MKAVIGVRHAFLWLCMVIVLLSHSHTSAEPLRRVRDRRGAVWEEYFDEHTQHFYYFNVRTKQTSWLLDFSKSSTEPSPSPSWLEGEGEGSGAGGGAGGGERGADDVIDEIFPVQLSKADSSSSFESLGVFPEGMEDIRMRRDVAGRLQSQPVRCMFDYLPGIQARVNYPMALKAPVAFHHMFISDEPRQETVAKERTRIEELLQDDPDNAENWENLGHVWRVYGSVRRAMDCYRRALEISPYDKSSFYINIAGLLDQMNYVQDALTVLDALMTSFDVFTSETESNLALGYVMAAQLHVRSKTPGNLTLASEMIDAALALHPQFFNAIYGLRQEIHYKNFSFGGPPWLLGGTGSWGHLKNPWLITDIVCKIASFIGLVPLAERIALFAPTWPLTSLFIRKCLNASPALFVGVLTRFVVLHGAYLPLFGASRIPVLILMSFFMHLSLATEYFLTDCLVLLFVGILATYEPKADNILRNIKMPPVKVRKKGLREKSIFS